MIELAPKIRFIDTGKLKRGLPSTRDSKIRVSVQKSKEAKTWLSSKRQSKDELI